MSSRRVNRSETSGFYGVFVTSVLNVPVKKNVFSRARRLTRNSGQAQVCVQSSLFSRYRRLSSVINGKSHFLRTRQGGAECREFISGA